MARRRLDAEMVSRGMVADVEAARQAIESRNVTVDGAPGLKAATLVSANSRIGLEPRRRFVSRGGDKLRGALDDFALDVSGMRCLDAGAGSGGFTDCLLQAEAAHVVAVDVGYGQFDWSVRTDPRVTLFERTNIRHLPPPADPFDLVVGDLSFVSLRSLARTLAGLAGTSATCVLLVKPQFEAAREQVGPGGVISDPAVWEESIHSAVSALGEAGLGTVAVAPSRLKGATGNQEFFVMARPGVPTDGAAVAAALEDLG